MTLIPAAGSAATLGDMSADMFIFIALQSVAVGSVLVLLATIHLLGVRQPAE